MVRPHMAIKSRANEANVASGAEFTYAAKGRFGVFTKPVLTYKLNVKCKMNIFSSGVVATINDGTASYNLFLKISGIKRYYNFVERSVMGKVGSIPWKKAAPKGAKILFGSKFSRGNIKAQ